jgi:photosystem II stability/assembly factor-like uncharacterized protein
MLTRTPMLTLPRLLPGLLLAAAATAWPAPARAAVGSWTSLLDGGPVWALAAHPTRRGWLFAGTKTNGVLRSTDSGATWRPADRGLYNAWVRCFAFDPVHPGVIFAGLQGGSPAVFKSTDGGNSWRPSAGGLPFGNVTSLAIDPRRPRTIYAGSDAFAVSGIFRSTDGGASWNARGTGLPTATFDALAVSPTTPGLLYAAAFGVFRSTNGGASWRPAGRGPDWVTALAIEPHSGALYAAASNGLFKSADKGRTWRLQLDLTVATVAIDPATPEDVYAGGAELFHSTDGGASWRRADADLEGFSVTAIAPVPGARGLVYAGTANLVGFTGALFKSRDRGASWVVGGGGLVDRNVLGLAINPAEPSTLYASDADLGIFKSVDGGLHWAALEIPSFSPEPGGAEIVIDPQHSSTLYLVGNGDLESTDGGSTWQPLGALPPFIATELTVLAIDPSDTAILYGAAPGALFKSPDGGRSWTVGFRGDPDDVFSELVVDPGAPATVYAAGAHFNAATSEPDGAALLKSTDAGATWVSIAQGLPAGLVRLAVEPTGSRLYAGTGGGLFASGDGGRSWERLEGITTEPVGAVAAPAKGQVFAVQVVAGVHWSRDGGDTWAALNRGLDFFPANVLVVSEPRPAAATLYLGLAGGGVQSYSLP